MKLEKYSMGIGDRFAHEAVAQLSALIRAEKHGVEIVPVWNKSFREHSIIGSNPEQTRAAADEAVRICKWKHSYYLDADHIGLKNVDMFIASCNFFTLDVADFIGKEADSESIARFADNYSFLAKKLEIPGIENPFPISRTDIEAIARKYLFAIKEAGKIYRKIESVKGKENFITEVSMDETDLPQTPLEMLFILAAVADEKIPAQTIAPKFSGRFNKGVDYVGDLTSFETEFNQDICVVAFATKEFALPSNLKLSVHSGSDKFSLYPIINRALRKHNVGLHLKTAGTTWLEEVIGLAESGGEGLDVAREIYSKALSKFDELCAPYATVIDIKKGNLPTPEEVSKWSPAKFANTLRHNQNCPDFNPDFRQLIHVGYKIAVQMGSRFTNALLASRTTIEKNVSENIFERHIKPIFIEKY
ncbi:MAG: tagaturonate epimerase family protein [Candidatus Nanoarchaeia archaeon]